ncbi:MAG: alpha/beta hydrolase [Chloroflexi bacterium AL-W]|nr:alpha/beta hydrolase [Chloroflexi bacterium AL-N1]NOK65104.1 alpha/beta hydrolase [Chloroflexi bacterium AL-N10]NOK72629.1 alpha/beta hydrolase [Chloroflexi bacterium AL-N5]NOK79283.1 alpha/beta hydrolase [Chloroflexi bacterium AL-W]NOK87199.1 alpha/beta hydrolase [Chloroflexi bacterium AL-N15]
MWRKLISLPFVAAVGWIGYSTLFVRRDMLLPHAVSGERRDIRGRAGGLSYYVAGEGEPMLLIHSVNAAASAYEVRPLFEHYCQHRRVYAVDLPGFGFSERSDREYTPRLYTDAIIDMLDEIERDGYAQPVDALAVSLGSEFLARAASECAERFRTVALVSPTGFRKGQHLYGLPESTYGSDIVRRVFSFPLWGRPLFDLLNTRVSANYFLTKTFGSSEAVDKGLWEYDYLTSHQPNAQHAPFAFVSGMLFSTDIHRVYESLTMPVWAPHGTRGDFSDFSNIGVVSSKANWTIHPFATGALPYFEQPEQFCAVYDAFLAQTFGRK